MLPEMLPLKIILETSYVLHGIPLVHLTTNTALKTRKYLAIYKILNNSLNSNFLSASLHIHSRKDGGQMKQHMATIKCHNNKLTVFWSSDEYVPTVPCLSFYLQSGWSFSGNKTISRH